MYLHSKNHQRLVEEDLELRLYEEKHIHSSPTRKDQMKGCSDKISVREICNQLRLLLQCLTVLWGRREKWFFKCLGVISAGFPVVRGIWLVSAANNYSDEVNCAPCMWCCLVGHSLLQRSLEGTPVVYSKSCWSWASQPWSASEKWQKSSRAVMSGEESLVLS